MALTCNQTTAAPGGNIFLWRVFDYTRRALGAHAATGAFCLFVACVVFARATTHAAL